MLILIFFLISFKFCQKLGKDDGIQIDSKVKIIKEL